MFSANKIFSARFSLVAPMCLETHQTCGSMAKLFEPMHKRSQNGTVLEAERMNLGQDGMGALPLQYATYYDYDMHIGFGRHSNR